MHQIVLYGAPGCHLCEQAAADLAQLRRRHEFEFHEVDIHSDPDLERRFLIEIPVIEVDGHIVSQAPIDLDAVAAALR
jgi:glutaredoxin